MKVRLNRAMLLFLALVTSSILACNKDEGGQGQTGTEGEEQATGEQVTAESTTPEQVAAEPSLGDRIIAIYVGTMSELREMLASRPSIETLRPQLDALRERAIQQLVPLGHEMQQLPQAEQDRIGLSFYRRAQEELGPIDWLNEALTHYREMDFNFSQEISKINIITQYAFFDLLCRQEPEEAQRLGISCE